MDEDAVAGARTQARRRLVGAFVLLVAGVIGFPLLFDTQPRPLSPQLPIIAAQAESQRSNAAAAGRVAGPSARGERPAASAPTGGAPAASVPPAMAPAPAPSSVASSPAAAAASPPAAPAVASKPASVTAAAAPPAAAAVLASAPAPAPASAAPVPQARATPSAAKPPAAASAPGAALPASPARPALPPPARPPEPTAAEGRFAVQVGAYSDATTLRETRQKVEKLGLRTYTQAIEGDAGKRTRVRVGPFATREEAQAAAAKLKAAGLPANLLTL